MSIAASPWLASKSPFSAHVKHFSYRFSYQKTSGNKSFIMNTRSHVPAVPRADGARTTRRRRIWEMNHVQIWYCSYEILFRKNQQRKVLADQDRDHNDHGSSTSEQNVRKRTRCLHQTLGLVSIHYHIHTIALLICLGLFLVTDFARAVPEGL